MYGRILPRGFECPVRSCRNNDMRGSENSCRCGSIDFCPIARGLMSEHDKEALVVGRLALRDDEKLLSTKAYFAGKKRGEG